MFEKIGSKTVMLMVNHEDSKGNKIDEKMPAKGYQRSFCWVISWTFENIADLQKEAFLKACKAKKDTDPSVKIAVLGHAPFNTWKYCLWTLCRHPNYFGEWMCWNSFVLMGIPSLVALTGTAEVKVGLALTFVMTSRVFYDCLNYWTGGEPAEHFSVAKRPAYKEYQKNTRMFFPFEVPFFDHKRLPGWPAVKSM